MKKTILLPILALAALSLTACGGSFANTQTTEQRSKPLDCTGLHMKNAQWHFTDANGNTIDANGACHKGMRHGNFEIFMSGKKVAVTKFIKNNESKTSCFANGTKSHTMLDQCLALAAQGK